MISKGGKRLWLCPKCSSEEICKATYYKQPSGYCSNCNSVWPWRSRININAKTGKIISRGAPYRYPFQTKQRIKKPSILQQILKWISQ